MVTEMNGHVHEYSYSGVGRTDFMLAINQALMFQQAKQYVIKTNDIVACRGSVVLMLPVSNSLFHVTLTIIYSCFIASQSQFLLIA